MSFEAKKLTISKISTTASQVERQNPTKLQLIGCSTGVLVSYLIYGIFQERITSKSYGPNQEKFDNVGAMLLCQCICQLIGSRLMLVATKQPPNKVPYLDFAPSALTYLSGMFLSNQALLYVDYPSQALVKSWKVIPVMFFSMCINRERYTSTKYLCMFVVTLGMIFFMNANHDSSVNEIDENGSWSHAYAFGIFLLFLSLIMDGLTGPLQQKLKLDHYVTTHQLMFHLNLWSFLYIAFFLVISGSGPAAFELFIEYPEMLFDVILFGCTSAIGQHFVFTTLIMFGPLVLAIVTTCRKLFTILLSMTIFDHTLETQQWVGIFLVITGLLMDASNGYFTEPHRKRNIQDQNFSLEIDDYSPVLESQEMKWIGNCLPITMSVDTLLDVSMKPISIY
eukprot:CFRG1636T1